MIVWFTNIKGYTDSIPEFPVNFFLSSIVPVCLCIFVEKDRLIMFVTLVLHFSVNTCLHLYTGKQLSYVSINVTMNV